MILNSSAHVSGRKYADVFSGASVVVSSYFISGILFYLIYKKGINWNFLSAIAVSIAISIFYSIHQVDSFIIQPSLSDKIITPVLVFVIYIVFWGISTKKIAVKDSKTLIKSGVVTYPIYLIHAKIGKTFYDLLSQKMNKYTALMIIIIFVLAMSYAMYSFVSRKFEGKIQSLLVAILPTRFKRSW